MSENHDVNLSQFMCKFDGRIDNFSPTDSNKAWLEAIVKRSGLDKQISKILSYESRSASEKGDNYMSDLTRVTMKLVLTNGRRKELSVIIKELPESEYRRGMIFNMNVFPKETVIYKDIFPGLEDIMNEFSDYSSPMWSKCLDYRPYDRIVLQDLTKKGYKMSDRQQGLDYEHSSLAIKSLAKFHALTAVLKSRQLLPVETFNLHMFQRPEAKMQFEGLYIMMVEKLIKSIEDSWGPEWKDSAERIRKILPKLYDLLSSTLDRDETKFNVLNHGDCWLNNMMFKYGIDSKTPILVKFVDFQMCFYNTPAYDLQYFLASTTNYSVRTKHINQLIEDYHEMLTISLEKYNYKGVQLTLDQLKAEMKRLGIYGLATGLMLLPLMLMNKEEVPDMEQFIKDAVKQKELTSEVKLDWPVPNLSDAYTDYMKLIVRQAEADNVI